MSIALVIFGCSDDGGSAMPNATDTPPPDGPTAATAPPAQQPANPVTPNTGPCASPVPVTLGTFELDELVTDFAAQYRAEVASPMIGLSASDEFRVEFTDIPEIGFDGAATGPFDLSMESDSATCSRCLLLRADGALSEWFQLSGTLTVNANPITGTLDAELTDVVLAPSSGIALQNETCYGISSATISATP